MMVSLVELIMDIGIRSGVGDDDGACWYSSGVLVSWYKSQGFHYKFQYSRKLHRDYSWCILM